MISRIALFVLIFTSANADPLVPPPLTDRYGNVTVLTVDLASVTDETTRSRVWQYLETERKNAENSADRKDEIQLARGLIELSRGRYSEAASLFEGIAPISILRDAALLYRTQALRLQGEALTKQSPPGRGLLLCRDARDLTRELSDLGPGPFDELRADEWQLSTLCFIRNLAAQGRLPEALRPTLALLSEGKAAIPMDREFLFQTGIEAFIHSNRREDARELAEEAGKEFPSSPIIKGYLQRLPPIVSQISTSEESRKEPPFELETKRRPQPEEPIFREASELQNQGKYIKAVEKYQVLFKDFPSTSATQKAGAKVQVALLSHLAKKPKQSVKSAIEDYPPAPLYALGRAIWEAGYDSAAREIYDLYMDNYPWDPQAGNVLFFLGRLDEDTRAWREARTRFEKVVMSYSGSPFADRAQFKVAWLSYLMKDNETALKWFQFDRSSTTDPTQIAQDLYWTARILERQEKKTEAEKLYDEIGRLAPLSYYAFLSKKFPTLKTEDSATSPPLKNFWNSYRVRRAKSLLSAGLPKPAGLLLKEVDLGQDRAASEFIAWMLRVSRQYLPAFSIASQVVNQGTTNRDISKRLAETFFSIDYEHIVRAEAVTQNLDPQLLFGLIKRESAYQSSAESRAGALGLMQLMPETARKVAQDAEEPPPERHELLLSHRNIKLGARYLAQQLKAYSGNVAYALAAYNAGSTRVDQWVKRWGELPTDEFIEMIPYEETRNYVKAVIRNYVFYARLLENRTVEWSSLISTSSK